MGLDRLGIFLLLLLWSFVFCSFLLVFSHFLISVFALLVDAYDEDILSENDGSIMLLFYLSFFLSHFNFFSKEKRVVLRLHPRVAPVQLAILPLMKKPVCPSLCLSHRVFSPDPFLSHQDLVNQANLLQDQLRETSNGRDVFGYDEIGSIGESDSFLFVRPSLICWLLCTSGKRYRRFDESGCPFCLTGISLVDLFSTRSLTGVVSPAVDFETLTNKDVTIRERDSGKQVRLPISTVLDAAKTDITQLSSHFSKNNIKRFYS